MSDNAALKQQLQQHIYSEFIGEGPIEELSYDLHLYDAGILDSIGTLQLADLIEKNWPIEIEAHDMIKANFSTIESISKLIEQKLHE